MCVSCGALSLLLAFDMQTSSQRIIFYVSVLGHAMIAAGPVWPRSSHRCPVLAHAPNLRLVPITVVLISKHTNESLFSRAKKHINIMKYPENPPVRVPP